MAERKRKKQGGKYYLTRELARGIAKAKLKKAGATRTCKKEHACLSPKKMREMGTGHILDGTHRSWFANHWREWAMKGIPA